jgi:hypothetical protein
VNLGAGILGCGEEYIVGDPLVILSIGRAGCRSKDSDSESGIAGGGISDTIELIFGDNILLKSPLRTSAQDVVELLVVILVHQDVFAGAESTHQTVVDAAEQLLFRIGNADNRELWQAMEVVDDARVLKLIDLVEDNHGSGAIVLLEPIDEFVVGRRLTVDVDGRTDIVENLVERAESGVVTPAVDVGCFDIEDLLSESFGDEFRDAGLANPAGTGDERRVGGVAVRDRFEDAREVVDFGIAMLNFPRNEASPEDTCIADHLLVGRCFRISS